MAKLKLPLCVWCDKNPVEVVSSNEVRVICAECFKKYEALRRQGVPHASIAVKKKWNCGSIKQFELPLEGSEHLGTQ